jgi:hypothetical protein
VSLSPRLFLVALLLLVVPAGVTALFLANQSRLLVMDGAQPGGMIAGRLVPGEGSAPGSVTGGVEIELVAVAPDRSVQSLVRTTSDSEGRFLLEAAPIEGHYELRAGSGEWQRSALAYSFLREPPPGGLTLTLRPAAQLELEFARRSGLAVRGGEWHLVGEIRSGWWSSLLAGPLDLRGKFSGTTLRIDGLPPLRATLNVDLGGGELIELVLDLKVGPNRHTIDV